MEKTACTRKSSFKFKRSSNKLHKKIDLKTRIDSREKRGKLHKDKDLNTRNMSRKKRGKENSFKNM
jgi:hypothetical protein